MGRSLSKEKYAKLCQMGSSVSPSCEIQLLMKFGNGRGYNKIEFEKANQIARIFEVNCFNQGPHRTIYFVTSYLNHSCVPNAVRERPDGKWTIQAIDKILPGDEICLSYEAKLFLRPTEERKNKLKYGHPWGFDCSCDLCQIGGSANGQPLHDAVVAEIKSGRRDRKKMYALLEELKIWMEINHPHAYGKYTIDDLNNGIMGSLLGLV